MSATAALTKLGLAERQLERVQMAWDPPDWADRLTMDSML